MLATILNSPLVFAAGYAVAILCPVPWLSRGILDVWAWARDKFLGRVS